MGLREMRNVYKMFVGKPEGIDDIILILKSVLKK
jgi:hypothetical protein